MIFKNFCCFVVFFVLRADVTQGFFFVGKRKINVRDAYYGKEHNKNQGFQIC